MSQEITKLYRTYSPSFNSYTHDGLGRDTYIGFNNGGFWNQCILPGTSMNTPSIQQRIRYQSTPHETFVPPFRYICDGSGRDSYIICNSGGLVKNSTSMMNLKLKDILRGPNHSIIKYCDRLSTRKYFSRSERENNTFLRSKVNSVIKRLYTNEKFKFIQLNSTNADKIPMLLKRNMSLPEVRKEQRNCRREINQDALCQKFRQKLFKINKDVRK